MSFPPHPPRNRWDVVGSVALLTVAWLFALAAAVGVYFALAVVPYCPASQCAVIGRVASGLVTGLVVGLVVCIAGSVVVGMLTSRRRLAWPYAASTLLLVLAAQVVGALGLGAGVGG